MNRTQQLQFCKVCTNRKMDMKQGLLCGLTDAKADFVNECPSFTKDETVVAKIDNEDNLDHNDALGKLSEKDIERFRSEQNLPGAIFAGVVAGVLAALIWAAITVSTGLKIGYVALAIGLAVGFAMRFIGKGIDPIFGYVGAGLALISCVLGNFFSVLALIANEYDLGYMQTLMNFDYSLTFDVLKETASGMDIIFYAIAAFEGYKFSFKTFTEKDIHDLAHKNDY